MQSIIDSITQWLKDLIIEGITHNLGGMFDKVNQKVGEIAGQVGMTPSEFNGGVFSMVRSLSETVIIPIAGIILTFVMCYELISMIIEKNNMHDIDTWIFFKWIFKTFVAVTLVTNTFDIIMAIFDVSQHVVANAAGVIISDAHLNVETAISNLETVLQGMGVGSLLGLYLQSFVIQTTMDMLNICIFIVIYGRMLEIYMLTSLAPIPMATLVNKEWGGMGQNYLKSLLAIGFQAFLIMVCVGIYAVLIQSIVITGDPINAIWNCLTYTVLLCFSLFKSASLSKSIFNAH